MSRGKWKRLSEVESVEIARRYAAGERTVPLMKEFGCGSAQFYAALRESGTQRRTRGESLTRYDKDETAFDAPLTSEALYWLGFLATDGCVVSNLGSGGGRDQVTLKLAGIDRDHVVAFRDFLRSDAPVTDSCNRVNGVEHPWSMVRVSSQRLTVRLAELGVTKRKTFTLRVADELGSSADFWRGAVDGDGTVGRSNGRPYVQFVSASEAFMDQFTAFCDALGVQHSTPKKQCATWRVSVGNSAGVLQLLTALYPDGATALARKRTTVNEVLGTYIY